MNIKYLAPKSLEEALDSLEEFGDRAKVLAGGTDIVPRINNYEQAPSLLVYIEGLSLRYIQEIDRKIVIGSFTTWSDLIESSTIRDAVGVLSDAAKLGGTMATRNAATIGGNLANASPAADLVPPLLVLESELVLISKSGERIVPLSEFFIGPGKTVLKQDEIIKEVHIPKAHGATAFQKLGRRKAMTLSVVNAAARLEFDDNKIDVNKKCSGAYIAIGSVAPTPIRCYEAEKALVGKALNRSIIWECASIAIAEASPINDQRATAWYRNKAGVSVVARAVAEAACVQID